MDMEKVEREGRAAKDYGTYAGGRPGPVTLRLREAYWGLHDDPRFSLPVNYDSADSPSSPPTKTSLQVD